MTSYLKSPCCGAAVIGMVDATLHPRYRVDGSLGPIIDAYKEIKYEATRIQADPHEAYCVECGGPVEVPHNCDAPWRHAESAP